MKLPKDIISKTYVKPRIFLCETDKTIICQLETYDTKGSFKFNAYDEISFTVNRTYTDMITGETNVNPFYDKIEALRLIYLEGFGYFEIQEPELVSDGIKEVKNVTAYGLEYTLAQKYIEELYINTGESNSLEVINAGNGAIKPITLYNPAYPKSSLLNIILEKIYGWTIGHVDATLTTYESTSTEEGSPGVSRTFEISRQSVYDFIVQDLCEQFNCFAIFDTINNTINIYAETPIFKKIGDGHTTSYEISPPFSKIGTVTIGGYKTTDYVYNPSTGELTLGSAPENGVPIEVTDASQDEWTTDVYISFDNLAQEVNVNYSADDIKTVLTVKGSDDLSIREVNMGLPYIVDLSYYYSPDWMGQELYDKYGEYLKKCTQGTSEYKENSKQMLEYDHKISYEENRLSLQYNVVTENHSTLEGTYYVRGGTAPNYYYIEVSLPAEYNSKVEHYYELAGVRLNETLVSNLYSALKTYYNSQSSRDISELNTLKGQFDFMNTGTVNKYDRLVSNLSGATTLTLKDKLVLEFLDEMWEQVGKIPLEQLYQKPYQTIESTNISAGWNDKDNENYWLYYPVTLILKSLDTEISQRKNTINEYKNKYAEFQNANMNLATATLMDKNFTKAELERLSPFLREDEYVDNNFIETDYDSIETIMKTKQELLECGRIELSKLCEPKLEFSMNLANIYALPAFEPIIYQFQLGNLIRVALRPDYVKRARLLQVDLNFEDWSDFSCEFGELTNIRTQSDIHADLLANALQGGKSVASNASYWNRGSDAAIALNLKIQQGLLDSTTEIKASDGNQGVVIDKYGIKNSPPYVVIYNAKRI